MSKVVIRAGNSPSDVRITCGGVDVTAMAADIRLRPDELPSVSMEVALEYVEVTGEGRWYAKYPATGEHKQVRAIEFVDGTTWRDE